MYNDRSVLENHHISTAYRYFDQPDSNPFEKLSKDDFRWAASDIWQLPTVPNVRESIIMGSVIVVAIIFTIEKFQEARMLPMLTY